MVAIITPTTLSVKFDHILPSGAILLSVPQPAFESLAFNDYNVLGHNATMITRPSIEAFRLARAAAAAGSILPIQNPIVPAYGATLPGHAPVVNASWNVAMRAPRLACDHMDPTSRDAIKSNVAHVMFALLKATSSSYSSEDMARLWEKQMFSYLAWTGQGAVSPPRLSLPFIRYNGSHGNEDGYILSDSEGPRQAGGSDLSVIVLPRLANLTTHSRLTTSLANLDWKNADKFDEAIDWAFEDATMLQCKYVVSNHSLMFTYGGQPQKQSIMIQAIEDVPQAQAFNESSRTMFFGTSGTGHLVADTNESSFSIDPQALCAWSFQAIADIFSSLVTGAANGFGASDNIPGLSATLHRYGESKRTISRYRSQILSTSLADTIELSPFLLGFMSARDLAGSDSSQAINEAASLIRPATSSEGRLHLKDAMQELFFNITMSMASSDLFQ